MRATAQDVDLHLRGVVIADLIAVGTEERVTLLSRMRQSFKELPPRNTLKLWFHSQFFSRVTIQVVSTVKYLKSCLLTRYFYNRY